MKKLIILSIYSMLMLSFSFTNCYCNETENTENNDQPDKVEAGKSASIVKGKYVGGKDIPVGTYIINKNQDKGSGIISLSDPKDNLEEDYPSIIYEYISSDQDCDFFIPMRKGSVLDIPFSCILTSVDYKFDFEEELYSGRYVGGIDIPVGKYKISNVSGGSEGGIVWAATPNDDLESEYPSILYEYITASNENKYFINVEENGIIYLPFTFEHVQKVEKIDFENDNLLFSGIYKTGDDIPEGSYTIEAVYDEKASGIIWVSAPSDDLENDYPSILYSYERATDMQPYRVSVENGGMIYLPFACTVVPDHGIVFN